MAEYLTENDMSIGFGLERIEMAVTNKYKYWNDYVIPYHQAINNNIKNNNNNKNKLSSEYEYLLALVN